jgi:carbamate kinase
MGPKVEAAVRFATRTGRRAAIGALADIPAIVAGRAGTSVTPSAEAGQATPRTTWNPARRGPRPLAGAG